MNFDKADHDRRILAPSPAAVMTSTSSHGLHLRLGGAVLGSALPVVLPRQGSGVVESTACRDQPVMDFARWLARQLQLPVRGTGPQFEVTLPEEDRELFGGRETLGLKVVHGRLVAVASNMADGKPHPQQVEPLVWLVERLASRGPAAHARPAGHPAAVHAIASRLFQAYRIDGGQAHLAGCQLDDRPFLRLTYGRHGASSGNVRHVFVAPDGSSVPDALVVELGLDNIEPLANAPTPRGPAGLPALIAAGGRMAAQQFDSRNPAAAPGRPLAAALVWTRYATGQIQFSVGDSSARLAFAGWASTLVPPPFNCPHTGEKTFHLAALDDGRIVAAEQIVTCASSGRRVLASEVVTCRATGRRVLPEFTSRCPILGETVLRDHFGECRTCGEMVSTPALNRGVCGACRALRPLPPGDPRLVWLTSEYRSLRTWRWWRLAETETCYIVSASGLVRRLLIVCDRNSLAIRHLASGSRGTRRWTALPRPRWSEVLR